MASKILSVFLVYCFIFGCGRMNESTRVNPTGVSTDQSEEMFVNNRLVLTAVIYISVLALISIHDYYGEKKPVPKKSMKAA